MTQLITGQHVSNKVHTNLTSFMTIEAAVESARRLPLVFHMMRKGHRIKLGSKANTMLGSAFNELRMRGCSDLRTRSLLRMSVSLFA